MNKYFSLFVFFFLIFACKEKPKTSKYGCVKSIFDEAPNQVMSFAFKSNSEIYKLMDIDSTKDTLSFGYKKQLIYYKQNNVKANLDFVILSKKDKSKNSQYLIYSGEALVKSYSNNIKQFFIDWPNGDTDSMYVDYIQDDSRDNPCCCQYPLQSLTLNGKPYIRKDEFDRHGIYIFER
jgi:hypothetical protein